MYRSARNLKKKRLGLLPTWPQETWFLPVLTFLNTDSLDDSDLSKQKEKANSYPKTRESESSLVERSPPLFVF